MNIICRINRHFSSLVKNKLTFSRIHLKSNVKSRFLSAGANNLDLSGIYPPLVTPFDCNEDVNYEKLKENIDLYNDIPFKGYVVQGSNGEYAYLNDEERVQVVSYIRKFAAKNKLVIAGSGCESTKWTIEMSKKMADAGADVLMVITPFYFKARMNSKALINHFIQVADSSPVPVIVYSVPANTGLDLPADVATNLSQHPNIIGMKDSAGDVTKFGHIVGYTQPGFQLVAGSASFLLPAYSVGAVGGICALANVLGREVCELDSLIAQGQLEAAKELQHRLILPNTAVTKQFGVAGLKQAMEWFGYYGGPCRSPLLPLSASETQELRAVFEKSGFL